jgi:hypothetical protein
MLLRGELTQEVIIDPLDSAENQRPRDQDEGS